MNDAKPTETEKLRALLDARGVVWLEPNSAVGDFKTIWAVGPWEYTALENDVGEFWVTADNCCLLSAEQAVDATLGRGECEQVLADCDDGLMPPFTAHCSKCGEEWGFTLKFCPNCGAIVAGTRDERKVAKR